MARGTGDDSDCKGAQPRSESALPPWPKYKKPLVVGDRVVFYRASEKDARGMGHTPYHEGEVVELSADKKGILVLVVQDDGVRVRVRLGQTAKMNLDGSNPGLPWSYYPNGERSMSEEKCQYWVYSSSRQDVRGHQCTHRRKGDSLYCGLHAAKLAR